MFMLVLLTSAYLHMNLTSRLSQKVGSSPQEQIDTRLNDFL